MAMPAKRMLSGRTLAERAANEIRHRIMGGEIAVGERIRALQLAQELDMSAVPVREALQLLKGEGLVIITGHRGATVAPTSAQDLSELYDLRLLLEANAVKSVHPEAFLEARSRIAAALGRLVEALREGDDDGFSVAHREFHFGIYACAGSQWQLRLIEILFNASERYRTLALHHREPDAGTREHELVMGALDAGDFDRAARLMADHLMHTRDAAFAHLNDA